MKIDLKFPFLSLLAAIFCHQFSTAVAQDAVFTYQGHVLDNGTPFTGTGEFQFALVTSTNSNHQAMATAVLTGTFVTSYNLVSGGNGYVTAPAVHIFGGGGSNATATATITGGVVTGITPGSAGAGYSNAPIVTIDPPPANIAYTTYWSNDGTSVGGSEPGAVVSAAVANGLFTVLLGDATQPNMAPIPAPLFGQPNLQLLIWFNDGTHGFAPLAPAQPLTPAPYAVMAQHANLSGFTFEPNIPGESPDILGGAAVNYISNGVVGAVIAGGGATNFDGFLDEVASNGVAADYSSVGGGSGNIIQPGSDHSVICGGGENTILAGSYQSVIVGGSNNKMGGQWSFIGGGQSNTATNFYSTITGGLGNYASGSLSTVCGGYFNYAGGANSFAAGSGAQAVNDGSFVWSDNSGPGFSSTAANQFAVRAAGGILFAADVQLSYDTYHNLSLSGGNAVGYLYGSFPALGDGIHLGYNYYYDASGNGKIRNSGGGTSRISAGYGTVGIYIGGVNTAPSTERLYIDGTGVRVDGTFVNNSDRNAKENFAPINSAQILEEVMRLPVSEWSYKEDPKTRHVGPMAQDFYAAFNIGTDEKHIAPIDEGGVAFAAIQALNQKVEAREDEIRELKNKNDALEKRLDALERMISDSRGK